MQILFRTKSQCSKSIAIHQLVASWESILNCTLLGWMKSFHRSQNIFKLQLHSHLNPHQFAPTYPVFYTYNIPLELISHFVWTHFNDYTSAKTETTFCHSTAFVWDTVRLIPLERRKKIRCWLLDCSRISNMSWTNNVLSPVNTQKYAPMQQQRQSCYADYTRIF